MTKDDFISKSEATHGVGAYGYDKVPSIFGSKEKIEILCHKHGYFLQRASAHYCQKQGCPHCAKEHLWDKRKDERITTEKFIERATSLWGDKYNYDFVDCNNARDTIKIICRKHGVFEKQVWNHLNGQGCPICAKETFSQKKRLGREEIIRRCNEVHKNKYIYSLVTAEKVTDKIKIICPEHGLFEQFAFQHIKGACCPICAAKEGRKRKRKSTMTQDSFIERATKKHNGFYLYDKTNFISRNKKITVTCPNHGDFVVLAKNHLHGSGCPQCAREKNGIKCRKTQEEFIRRAKEIHGNRYIYDKTIYITLEDPVTITCPNHGDYIQTPTSHLNGHGCPHCHRSKGEVRVANFLNKNGIKYEIQKKIPNLNLFGGRKYFLLDFYIPIYNVIIEYNGEQHYKSVGWFGGDKNYKIQKLRDESLRQYCKGHNIKLIEIPYTDFDNIEKILTKELKIKKKY